jgi:HK97 family phage portal protein
MLGNLFGEERTLSYQQVFANGEDFVTQTEAGVTINSDTAFKIVAFFSAVSLYSDTISTLPVDAFIRLDGDRKPYRPKPTWIDQPDVDLPRQAHYGQVVTSLLVNGNSYTRVYRDRNGDVVNLVVIDPLKVKVERSALGRKVFIIQGEPAPLTSKEVLHIIDLAIPGSLYGVSRVEKLKDALGVATALQNFAARFFQQGATTNGVIEFPGNLIPEQLKAIQEGFDSRHRGWRRAHKTGVLFGGATYKDTSVPNDKAQFLESRRFAVEEMARAFNVPLHMMGIPGTNTYASVEQNNLQWISHSLRPILEKIEWAYSQLLPGNAFIKFNFNALLRGDLQSRATAYSIMLQQGAQTINEVRRFEDLPPVEGGDTPRVPLANVSLSAANLQETQLRVNMADTLIKDGFDPSSVLEVLSLPQIEYAETPEVEMQEGEMDSPDDEMMEEDEVQ